MNYVYIAASVDGYIATVDGGVDWLDQYPNPEKSDYGYSDFIRNIDAVVMGRHTFEKVMTFGEWPYDKNVFVLSRFLTTVPDALKGRVELMSGSPEAVVESIN
ncbi:MAG: dihydrofolate reductase, partial [Desulfobacterales bacterium]|nr:dihydrofolate reductase [Desulfobacterales bacterium]